MYRLELKKIVKSQLDNTIKYIFYTEDRLIVEFSYLNKNDGKDIICVSSQTFCSLGCLFCHTTEHIGKIKNRNLNRYEITHGVDYIYKDLKLSEDPKTLLISVMGIGEPILNVEGVIGAMLNIKHNYKDIYTRFAFATSLPERKYDQFFEMTKAIDTLDLPVKLHVSLHYTNDTLRKEWMPNSLDISSTISAADFYKKRTGNPVEIHYALLEGINDTEEDAIILTNLIKGKGFDVKFLFYNKKDINEIEPSDIKKIEVFAHHFKQWDIKYEYYKPVGLDIGASCGQFILQEYLQK